MSNKNITPYIPSDTLELPENHCCVQMTKQVTTTLQSNDPYTDSKCLIICVPHPVRYGIINHGDTSFDGINFCPFCGSALPGSYDTMGLLS